MKYVLLMVGLVLAVGFTKIGYEVLRPRTQMEICVAKVTERFDSDSNAKVSLALAVAFTGKTAKELISEACADYFAKGGPALSSK